MHRAPLLALLVVALPAVAQEGGERIEARPRLDPQGRVQVWLSVPWPAEPLQVHLVPGPKLSPDGLPLVEVELQPGVYYRARVPGEWLEDLDGRLIARRPPGDPLPVRAYSDRARPLLLDDPRAPLVAEALAREGDRVLLELRGKVEAGRVVDVTELGLSRPLGTGSAREVEYLHLAARVERETLAFAPGGAPLEALRLPAGAQVIPTGRSVGRDRVEVLVPLGASALGAPSASGPLHLAVARADLTIEGVRPDPQRIKRSGEWALRPDPAALQAHRGSTTTLRATTLVGAGGAGQLTLGPATRVEVEGIDSEGRAWVTAEVARAMAVRGWVPAADLEGFRDVRRRPPGAAPRPTSRGFIDPLQQVR